ncbi:MAG: DUF4037 domain-containing protein [Defluviitaleaceae bacterium]|nr:DUF4037 domain-containing protein [Defluviitaleaceae bacterium]
MFTKGLELCERFFHQAAKPIMDKYFGGLAYSAGLLGYGSDVLGYDDEVSADHMWGPRFYLFLSQADVRKKQELMDAFAEHLPYDFEGHSVNFSVPDASYVRRPEVIRAGKVSPLISIHTFDEYLAEYLGTADLDNLTPQDWLYFSEHRLLGLTSGKLFVDGLGIAHILEKLRYYPEDVRLYLIASNWSLIAEEQAFVRRCFDVGDNIGSAIICARMAGRLMRLAFLYCGCYAPYSKWFGTAFSRLPIDAAIGQTISRALSAMDIDQREDGIVLAQKLLADMHNTSGLTKPVKMQIESYYGRDIKVIFAEKIADVVVKKLSGTELEGFRLIGASEGILDKLGGHAPWKSE